jgi:hypothetical protein
VPKTIDAALRVGDRVVLQPGLVQQHIELTREDASRRLSVRVLGKENVVFAASIRVLGVGASFREAEAGTKRTAFRILLTAAAPLPRGLPTGCGGEHPGDSLILGVRVSGA